MQNLIGTPKSSSLLPTVNPPKEVRLRGACGPGFGRGQLLGRMHMTDQTRQIVVERVFMPSTLANNFTTRPFAYQTRPFAPSPNVLKEWTYVIVEVAINSVSVPVFQIEYLDGGLLSAAWAKLSLSMFNMDERTVIGLSIITSLAYKGRKFENRYRGYVKNFPEADHIDTSGYRPRRRERADAIDTGWHPPSKLPAVPAAAPKITIEADESGVMAFLATTMRNAKAEVKAYDPVAEEAAGPDDRSRQQNKPQGGRPRQARPFNGLAGQLAGLRLPR
jgi:hypothetical protein